MDREQLEKGAQLFSALANPQRLEIMLVLAESIETELSLSELQAKMGGMAQSSLSTYVTQLRTARLVIVRREAKWVRIRIADASLIDHIKALAERG